MHRNLLAAGLALGLAALAPRAGAAQTPAPRDTARAPIVPPAVVPPPVARADSARRITPKGAFVRSLVFPGWGQSAIGSPGRGAVYFALEAGSVWMTLKSRQKLHYARQRARWEAEQATTTSDVEVDNPLVGSRQNQVEDWLTLSGFLLLFNAADAFVAAHLADFDQHVGAAPGPRGGVQLQGSVPVGKRP
ncbi:MAG: hypothetical protein JO040_02490 [Gemmatimonadetes bacterium]|nr:hypothetical protein [Gemmatimonadota bacterium]